MPLLVAVTFLPGPLPKVDGVPSVCCRETSHLNTPKRWPPLGSDWNIKNNNNNNPVLEPWPNYTHLPTSWYCNTLKESLPFHPKIEIVSCKFCLERD